MLSITETLMCVVVAFKSRALNVVSKNGHKFFDLLELKARVVVVLHVIDMTALWWFELPHVYLV